MEALPLDDVATDEYVIQTSLGVSGMTRNSPESIDKWYSIRCFGRSLAYGNKYATGRSSNYGKILLCFHGYLKEYSRFASARATDDPGRVCSKRASYLSLAVRWFVQT